MKLKIIIFHGEGWAKSVYVSSCLPIGPTPRPMKRNGLVRPADGNPVAPSDTFWFEPTKKRSNKIPWSPRRPWDICSSSRAVLLGTRDSSIAYVFRSIAMRIRCWKRPTVKRIVFGKKKGKKTITINRHDETIETQSRSPFGFDQTFVAFTQLFGGCMRLSLSFIPSFHT